MEANPNRQNFLLSKVPQITIFFWIIKILCTTVGETFADYINFNLGLGLSATTIIMGIAFFVVLFVQFRATKYIPGVYWLTVVLISVFGTLVTDNLTDNIGVPLETSTIVFSVLLGLTFLFWYMSEKTLSIHSIHTRKREAFYWLTILFTFALGTAVGDLFSEQLGLGYLNTGITVIVIIAIVFSAWKWLRVDGVLAFWIAYILTRPLGASIGDYLSQPARSGGLGLGTTITSVIFLVAILAITVFLAISKYDTTAKQDSDEAIENTSGKGRVLIQTIVALILFLAAGTGGYIGLSNNIASQTDSAQGTLAGQLTDFVTLENDMLKSVQANDFATAKNGADELERQWDTAEPKLRKIDGSTWTQIDGTIDVVLAAVRSGKPNAGKCQTALNNSLKALTEANNAATKPASSSANKLAGQLSEFIDIEKGMQNAVNQGNFASAKQGADKLEQQWDKAEPKLRKTDGKTWVKIDGTIDVVLAAVRSGKPDAGKCTSALTHSLSVLTAANQ